MSQGLWVPYKFLVYTSDHIVEMVENDSCDVLIVEEPVRFGKALALDTPIPTPSGWTTLGELHLGNEVFDGDGKPCRVKAVSETWVHPSFVVTTDDGDEIVAHENHEWLVTLDDRSGPNVHETKRLAARAGQKPRVHVAALDLPDVDLPTDPYVLGVWLGDGYSSHATIAAHDDDAKWLRQFIDEAGYVTTDRKTYQSFGVKGLQAQLRAAGLLRNKHIPAVYLRAGNAQRLALVQGLVDTDGYVSPKGHIEFCSTNRALAEGVQELVRSLGVKCSLVEGRATLYGKDCGPRYRVHFYLADAARLPRKAMNTRNAMWHRSRRYLGFRPMEPVPTRCIEVDSPGHLFLAGRSMTPTRNTELCSRWAPAWYLSKYPDRWVGLASYEASFAQSHSAIAREWFVQYGPTFGAFPGRSKAAQRWITAHGGGMWASGVGGSITGKGFNLGIIDDPIKNDEEADSELQREKAWEWFRATFSTRRNTLRRKDAKSIDGKIMVVMSRWHTDDLVGRMKADLGHLRIKTLTLPAIAEDDDPIGRQPGESLCPERFTVEQLEERRQSVGPRWWSALYQQRPQPASGGKFKRSTFRYWRPKVRDGVRYFDLDSSEGALPFSADECGRYQIMDVAATRTKTSDYTVLTTWAVTPRTERHPTNLLLLDMKRVRVEGAEHLPLIRQAYTEHRPVWLGIERSPIALTLIGNARLAGIPVRELKPNSNKVIRAEAAVNLFENARLYLPYEQPWLDIVETELLEFPSGKHDDIVDTFAYAAQEFTLLKTPQGMIRKPEEDVTLEGRMAAHKRRLANDTKGRKADHPILGVA